MYFGTHLSLTKLVRAFYWKQNGKNGLKVNKICLTSFKDDQTCDFRRVDYASNESLHLAQQQQHQQQQQYHQPTLDENSEVRIFLKRFLNVKKKLKFQILKPENCPNAVMHFLLHGILLVLEIPKVKWIVKLFSSWIKTYPPISQDYRSRSMRIHYMRTKCWSLSISPHN